jgi:CBS domain-containing protein
MRRIQRPIADFISPDASIVALSPDDPVSAAVEVMKAHKWDCALVLEGDALVGIFTERDFLYRVSAAQKNPTQTKLRDVMTPNPETLRARDAIPYAINRMVGRGFRNSPIVDDTGKPVAVLDVRDVLAHLTEVFAEVTERTVIDKEWEEWTDTGGGA